MEQTKFKINLHQPDSEVLKQNPIINQFFFDHKDIELTRQISDSLATFEFIEFPTSKQMQEKITELGALPADHPFKNLVVLYWDQEQANRRLYSTGGINLLAQKQNIFIHEFSLEMFESKGEKQTKIKLTEFVSKQIYSHLENLAYFKLKLASKTTESLRLWKRYLWAHHNRKQIGKWTELIPLLKFSVNSNTLLRSEEVQIKNFSLWENHFPKDIFETLEKCTVVQNRLWLKMANDFDFIKESLAPILNSESDQFLTRTVEMAERVKDYPHRQKNRFVISRNDFMVNEEKNKYFQIEYNLIACGLLHFSTQTGRIIKLAAGHCGDTVPELTNGDNAVFQQDALKMAYDIYIQDVYGEEKPSSKPIIVIIHENGIAGIQQSVPTVRLQEQYGVTVRQYEFEDVFLLHSFDEETGKIYVNGEEVALFYYRAGYVPEHFESENAWEIQEIIQKSKAVKCPDVFTFIINFKYFQSVINKYETWERFGFTEAEFEESSKSFARIKTIEDFGRDKEEMKKYILQEKGGAEKFVLKPQLEGGGNNYFGQDIMEEIDTSTETELGKYILMDRIFPTSKPSLWTDTDTIHVGEAVSELGLFSWAQSKGDEIVAQHIPSRTKNCLIRTKRPAVNEGGIIHGGAFVDQYQLV